jgi:cyclopropane fatty-acyl-phospholipid synthase-like methyltransferase
VLDAGCGTGILTLALREALLGRGFEPGPLHGFDLTPAMLDRFRATLESRHIDGDIQLAQADVLDLRQLPSAWSGYDLIVTASMLEYLPRARVSAALRGLRSLLGDNGRLVLFITRQNALMRPLIGRWWGANLYQEDELVRAFRDAGFASVRFRQFPLRYRYLELWGHIVEAEEARQQSAGAGAL